jgi:hypothetical protein
MLLIALGLRNTRIIRNPVECVDRSGRERIYSLSTALPLTSTKPTGSTSLQILQLLAMAVANTVTKKESSNSDRGLSHASLFLKPRKPPPSNFSLLISLGVKRPCQRVCGEKGRQLTELVSQHRKAVLERRSRGDCYKRPAARPIDSFHDSIGTSSICSIRAFYARVWFIIRHDEVAFYRMRKEVRVDL